MRRRTPLALAVLTALILLDQLTKYLASTMVEPFEPVVVLPFINLVNVVNPGAAFGLLSSMSNVFFIAVTLLATAIILYLLSKGEDGFWGLTLILSGALGNFIDRLALGHVRDFMDLHVGGAHWPAFNVADSALTIGVGLLILGFFRSGTRPQKPEAPETG